MRTGHAALRAWLADRAREAERIVQPEEALLGGRFGRYAARRLLAFGLARGWVVLLHIVELTWLTEVFTAKAFVASIALLNVMLVVDAAYWGALEAMRRRVRALGPSSEAAALTSRWLTVALWAGGAIVFVPIGRAAFVTTDGERTPTMLHVYALTCALRLGIDVALRTYYSGVFAHRRVHRPVWSIFVGPTVLVGITIFSWEKLGGWSFPVALTVSTLASRGLLLVFTRRAYRIHRIPAPAVRLIPRFAKPDPALVRDAILGSLANLTTRLGGVVLLAAIVPSLADYSDDSLAPFAFALHLAAPAISLVSQWGLLFYHDYKRLEDEAAMALVRVLDRRLVACGALLGVVAWAVTCLVVSFYLPLGEVTNVLVALLPAMIGQAIWTAVQTRSFAHGEFRAQTTSAIVLLVALWVALSSEWTGAISSYLALAATPWSALAIHLVLARVSARRASGEAPSVAAFVRALRAARGEVIAWYAEAPVRAALVEQHLTEALGSRGVVTRDRTRLFWFERCSGERAPITGLDWLRSAGGALADLHATRRGRAAEVIRELHELGGLEDLGAHDAEALTAEHARLFPDGFAVVVGGRPPARFAALTPRLRQAIWSDAIRDLHRPRGRGAAKSQREWYVTTHAPDGAIRAIFATPGPVDPAKAARWRAELRRFGWQVKSTDKRNILRSVRAP
jgi:hypothetical protein